MSGNSEYDMRCSMAMDGYETCHTCGRQALSDPCANCLRKKYPITYDKDGKCNRPECPCHFPDGTKLTVYQL